MDILNIANTIKKMTVNELRDFIFENCYKQIGFARENSYDARKHQKKKDLQLFATKLTEKIPDPSFFFPFDLHFYEFGTLKFDPMEALIFSGLFRQMSLVSFSIFCA